MSLPKFRLAPHRAGVLAAAVVLSITVLPASAQGPRSLQGDSRAWTQDPHLHQVWERLRLACAQGCAKADAAAFQHDAIALLQDMAPAVGMTRQAMADHVAMIPRQMLAIGQEDPLILSDYDRFIVALVGPP